MRVGVIGLGVMGVNHARVYKEIGAELVALCEADPKRATDAAKRFGCAAETDLEKFLARDDIEAVSIVTPTVTHAEVAGKALAAGKHVLVEKPITPDVASARRLLDAARKAGKVLAVGHIERHNPAVLAAKELLARGEIGALHTLHARRVNQPTVSNRIQDVGIILDLAIHDIDVTRYLTGNEPTVVYATGAKAGGSEKHEARTVVQASFADGAVALLEASRLTNLRVRTLTLTGADGSILVDYIEQGLSISRSRLLPYDETQLFQLPLEFDHRNFRIRKQEPLANELKDFLDAAATNKVPLVTGDDGLRNLAVAEAAVRSWREGRAVPLKEVLDVR